MADGMTQVPRTLGDRSRSAGGEPQSTAPLPHFASLLFDEPSGGAADPGREDRSFARIW